MKNNILQYKGYHAKIVFDNETFSLRGKIEGINDLVNFESKDLNTIEQEFHDAVDDYLELCKEVGKKPEKEYKGTFNVRISPELHKKIALMASKNGDTLNKTIEKALEEYTKTTTHTEVVLCEKIDMLSEQLSAKTVIENGENKITVPFLNGYGDMKLKYLQ
ncbi:MAG TPA: type II toxin-antitoxin system HicB family antitoxin [Candidatus Mediterraneibacter pullistercoris]|nr:type II toxin-antitoxin system HicB family antitoxin [Candidatus Mediterraneibacter pullistercoris]